MSKDVPVKVVPPETQIPRRGMPSPLSRPRFSKRRLALAFTVAALADGLSVFLTLTPPAQWVVDLATAFLLFLVLGQQWMLLPCLIMEAIPGIYMFPLWVLVAGAVAAWGTARPSLDGTLRSGEAKRRGTAFLVDSALKL